MARFETIISLSELEQHKGGRSDIFEHAIIVQKIRETANSLGLSKHDDALPLYTDMMGLIR